MTCIVISMPKERPFFIFLRCYNDFTMQKVYFLLFMRVFVGLMFVACPGLLDFYWSAGFGTFLEVSALASHLLEDCVNFMSMPEKNDQYSGNHF